MSRRPLLRPADAGFVTLTALLIMLAITVIGAITITSLLGEIQGERGYNEAVSATSVAEAGAQWAVNKMTGASAATQVYQGNNNQTVQTAGGQQVGTFDALVTCTDQNHTPVDSGSAGCATNPNDRLIQATGYVPSKAGPLGTRTIWTYVQQNTIYNKTLCAYQGVTLSQGVSVQGDVGAEGAVVPNLSLQGPSGSAAQITAAGNMQPGSAYSVTNVSCSQGCAGQVAGTVNNNQTPGTVCPPISKVWNTYTCTPGSTPVTVNAGSPLVIDSTNNQLYSNITVGSGGVIIFDTTTSTNVLTVNVNSISAGSSTQFIVKNRGIVQLNIASQLTVGQGSGFGLDWTNMGGAPLSLPNPIPSSDLGLAGHLIVRSCNTGTPSPAIWFNQTGGLSAVFVAPYGNVKMDQAQGSQGAILAANITLDQSTQFGFDTSASAVGLGFNKLVSWQDVP